MPNSVSARDSSSSAEDTLMASRTEMQQLVRDAFAARHKTVPAPPGDEAIVTVALALLRRLHDPTGGALAAFASTIFGALPVPAQPAGAVAASYPDGLRDNPPFLQRVEMGPTLRSWFSKVVGVVPQPAELDVLVNVEVGIIHPKFQNGPPQAKQGV